MTVPTCGITHDVVIYDGLGNLDPIGLIVKPFSYRVSEAPNLVPRMAVGDPKGTDYEGQVNWVQDQFIGGGLTRAPATQPTRTFESLWLLPTRDRGYLGISTFPQVHSIVTLEDLATTVDSTGLNHWYEYPQRRWHYLHQIRTYGHGFRDRIITFVGAMRPVYAPGDTVERQADWGNNNMCTVDACAYSGVVVIATQQSWNGRFQPARILVHYNSSHTYLASDTSAAAVTSYDGQLWRAGVHKPYIAWYDIASVNDSIVPTWSEAITVGTSGRVMRMTSFMGRLFIAKTDGVWAYEAGRTYCVVDYKHMMVNRPLDCQSFDIFLEAHGALYWNIGNRLVRYTSGGLLEELGGQLDSRPVSAAVIRRGLAIITPQWLWVLDTNTGGLSRVCASPKRPLHLVGSVGGDLHISPYRATWMAGLGHEAVFWSHPYAAAAGEPRLRNWATDTGWLGATEDRVYVKTAFTDLGYPALIKSWQRAIISYQGMPSSSFPSMSVYYRTAGGPAYAPVVPPANPTTGFTLLGTVSVDSETPGVSTFDFDAVTSQAVQLLVTVATANSLVGTNARPVIYAVEVEGRPLRTIGKHTRRLQYAFGAVVTDGMELLTGAMENSSAYITAALFSLSGTGAEHIVALPYPPPVGHTVSARVELGPTGAAVPVLPSSYSQCPSGCPGADISLIVTEL